MPLLRQVRIAHRDKVDAEALARIAETQHGVISSVQLQSCGLSRAAISRWTAAGRLHHIHPHVYAVGHTALSLDGRLAAALLYAGRDAAFSHTTAAWLWRLIDAEPRTVHLTVPGRRRSLPGVRVHHSRDPDQVHRDGRSGHLHCRGSPVTSPARTLLDIAGILSPRQLRRAVSEADYLGLLDPTEAAAALRRGRRGSRALREALANHLPQLALTLSELEERFLELCEAADLPLPEVNAKLGRMRVDALWREGNLAVELDGVTAHGRWAAIKRDRAREMALRAQGLQVVRYSWQQVTEEPAKVAADVRRLLGQSCAGPRGRISGGPRAFR